MKILLLGEYSNVHHTLAMGLRRLGHTVTVASDGDGWKNYPRDIDTARSCRRWGGGLLYWMRMKSLFRSFKGYDIVQIINPIFLELRAERMWSFYKYLRQHNRKVILGAFGTDHYYLKACLDFATFKYSDFNVFSAERESAEIAALKDAWLNGSKGMLNIRIAEDCDAIVAGLYEYYASYKTHFENPDKIHFIPFPITLPSEIGTRHIEGTPLRLFIGIQRSRSQYKGTDIMLRAARRVAKDFPKDCTLQIAENVPFVQYVKLFNSSDVILDQLYSYTPAMNALEAMAHGMVVVGGGEPEGFDLLAEKSVRPVVNVQPDEESVYEALKDLVEHKDVLVAKLQEESYQYVAKHHDYLKVARQYVNLYERILSAGHSPF